MFHIVCRIIVRVYVVGFTVVIPPFLTRERVRGSEPHAYFLRRVRNGRGPTIELLSKQVLRTDYTT